MNDLIAEPKAQALDEKEQCRCSKIDVRVRRDALKFCRFFRVLLQHDNHIYTHHRSLRSILLASIGISAHVIRVRNFPEHFVCFRAIEEGVGPKTVRVS
jgi:hypothetical protein